ncbi:hypothetical protein JR316_0009845 [Psilocybe cubensis]|uniref:Uncharacterized protein n=2 Tax=Psilocybe cubensis TaxID=181762 RepID=A0ACB8GRF2_PSICU|nr:hypothetical protein JR316_0009845 [Psilocybe cubensis]KAH9477619.1 hypothetical protein JR316_0009845 [Psilocybe cubensis]
MTVLFQLPIDIHVYIFNFLSPSDILTMRKTCKTICTATFLRVVWIAALKGMCIENTVYDPSFPIEEMSIRDMERAAMGPQKWEKIVNKYTDQPTPPIHITTLSEELIEYDAGRPHELFLIPGGRFLVTLLVGYLSLWDLSLSCMATPKLMGRRWMDTAVCTIHPSSDGLSIRILTIPSRTDFDTNK